MKDIDIVPSGDPCSYSDPASATTEHIDIDWSFDFPSKTVTGSVLLHLNIKDLSLKHLNLDSRELNVTKVVCEESGQNLKFELANLDANYGSKFTVNLPSLTEKCLRIRVFYSTSPSTTALTWMTPEQTSGKKLPFVFSQCEPIHARALLPCQDTPSVKATYSATVKCDRDFVVLMSALSKGQDTENETGQSVFRFNQPVPIPSYLVAVVVGDLVSQEIGPRSKVWCEKQLLEASVYEFADTEKMLTIAESICGAYEWTQYDLLILPPSFPYGGMENPCLTFITPALLVGDRSLADVVAHEISHSWTGNLVMNCNKLVEMSEHTNLPTVGDRSLADVVAHEISHSWTGNLVTNCSWEHFWLNEGFTNFMQRKIEGRLHGDATRHLSAIEGWQDLESCIKTRGADDPLTCLVPRLEGVNPDDAFSSVPYEKGHTMLWYLEELVGGPDEFEPFLKAYLTKFRRRSIDTPTFKNFLINFFPRHEEALNAVDWKAWLHTPGMPPYKPPFNTSLIDACTTLCESWAKWDVGAEPCTFTEKDLSPFSSNQKIVWIGQVLESSLSLEKVQKMAEIYKMDDFSNCEIRFRWLRLCLKVRWMDKVGEALTFVNTYGRMKYVRPIYRDLYAWEEVRSRAQKNFKEQRKFMAFVSSYTIAKDLHLTEQS